MHPRCYATTSFQRLFIAPKGNLVPTKRSFPTFPSSSPQAAADLLSVSVDLRVVETSHKWSLPRRVFGVWPPSQPSASEAHSVWALGCCHILATVINKPRASWTLGRGLDSGEAAGMRTPMYSGTRCPDSRPPSSGPGGPPGHSPCPGGLPRTLLWTQS